MSPSITVITPLRPERIPLMLVRARASVKAQWLPAAEHWIVCDGPDDDLRNLCAVSDNIQYAWARDNETPHWGAAARNRGQELASGDLIAYLDDDDAYRPWHLAVLAGALEAEPGAQWAYAAVDWHRDDGVRRTYANPPQPGHVSSLIMHRRSLKAQWERGPREDWDLLKSWMDQGIRHVAVDLVTADAYADRTCNVGPIIVQEA